MSTLKIIAAVSLVVVILNLFWRYACRYRSLPCPTCFAWFLESPFWNRCLGTTRTLERIGLTAGQHVLEIGPGPGRLLIPAAQKVLPGGVVVGVDIQPGMIRRLEARAKRADVTNLTAILGDATEAHVDPDAFDLAFLCTTLGEIPNRDAALRQCHAALKSDGVLSITELFPDPHFQSQSTVIQLANKAGFRLREVLGSWFFFTANFVKQES